MIGLILLKSIVKKVDIKSKVDDVQGIAQNKTIILDGARLITGSYNFSNAANVRNSENMLYIQDEEMAKIYRAEWYKSIDK